MGTAASEHNNESYDYYSLRQLPMIAGLLAPVCVLLSIPPLTGSWVSKDNDILGYSQRSFQTDKTILGLLGTGLVCLFFAHFTLLLRFLERHIVWNTWISITGYFINFCLTLGAALYYQLNFPLQKDYHYAGEFYATYGSSVISFLISSLLVTDFFKHNYLKGRGSGLSRNQRVLVFMSILVTLWTVFGALVMGSFENWSFTRGIYFALVTMTTIGFGDYAPSSNHARGFNIFYASVGIIMVGMFIAFIRSVILESFEHAYLKRMEQIGTLGLDNFYTLNFQTHSNDSKSQDLHIDSDQEKIVRTKSVKDQEKDLKKAQLNQYIRQLHFSIFALFLFWFLGAGIFCWIEDWDYFTAFYFCFVSFTTIGYGDITVRPFASVVAFCVYSLIGLVTMAYFISVATELFSCLIDTHSDRIERKRKRKVIPSINRHQSQSKDIRDPQRDIDLLEVLETNTGNEEKDLIQKLLIMTEFYHQEVTHFVKRVAEEEELNSQDEAQLNSIQLKKMEKYEKIYVQLVNLCKKKLASNPSDIFEPTSLLKNQSSEYLIEPNRTFGNN